MSLVRPGLVLLVLGALLVAGALALAGCGGGHEKATPVACLEGKAAYLEALKSAPGEVIVAGAEPISECLAENQDPGELSDVGEALIGAATTLNAEAREDPGGAANLELGYLVGAAEAGASDTEGIHTNLLQRLAVAARFAPGGTPLPKVFKATYEKGVEAGEANG
jgi:hypothetical protein